MFMQGWGQIVVTGQTGTIKKTLEGGPHRAMLLEFDARKDEARPEVDIISSNPPVDGWMKTIEQTVALLLSTNNLSPRNISATLNAATYPSGIAQLIDMSESTEDVRDSQGYMALIERKFWKAYAAVHNYYYSANLLIPEQQAIGKLPDPEMFDVTVKFNVGREVISEKERLENMKLKKELGLTTQIEMLMQENPGMTQEEAEQKLLKIKQDRLENQLEMADQLLKGMENKKPSTGTEQPGQKDEGSQPSGSAELMSKQALNGAQVSSLVEIVTGVAKGEIPRESALEMLQAAFPFIDQAWANQILSSAGKGFKAPIAPPRPAPEPK